MKAIRIFSVLIIGFIITTAFIKINRLENFGPADEQAIKSIIEEETAAYFQRDSIKLFSFYVDDNITQTNWNSPNGSYGSHKGFKNIRRNFTQAFIKYPKPMKQPKVDRTDWFFKPFSDEWMWVNFIQKNKGDDGKLYTSYETRVMKKVKGNWKIAVMYSLSDHAVAATQ
jgi:hypothetical protein